MCGMTKSSKPKKRLSEQKNSSDDTLDNRSDLFCGEELYELVEKLQFLEKEHSQQVQGVDSLYQDVFDGQPYLMYTIVHNNKKEITLLREIIRTLQKINENLENMGG